MIDRRQYVVDRVTHVVRVPALGPCWEWRLCLTAAGYGKAHIEGVTDRAHRVSFRAFHGPIPEGMGVCHHCDNPRCANPEHLFAGTQLDNMRDRSSKGRAYRAKGVLNSQAKLTAEQVAEARAYCANHPRSQRKVARALGISDSQMSAIISGTSWKSE